MADRTDSTATADDNEVAHVLSYLQGWKVAYLQTAVR